VRTVREQVIIGEGEREDALRCLVTLGKAKVVKYTSAPVHQCTSAPVHQHIISRPGQVLPKAGNWW